MALSCSPAAARNKMRARSTTRAGSDRPRAHCSSAARCSGLSSMAGAIRIRSRLLNIRREQNNKGCYLRRTTLAVYAILALVFAVVGVAWPSLKVHLVPRFSAFTSWVERLASDYRYKTLIAFLLLGYLTT